jgi:FkbM family methyltransferase
MSDKLQSELDYLLNQNPSVFAERNRARFDAIAGGLGRSLVLFGAGPLGRKTLQGLRRAGIEPLAFADNKAALWHQPVDGVQVLPPPEAVQKFGTRAVFVATIYNPSAVMRQLRGLGCPRVASYSDLYWKHPETFLPYGGLHAPEVIRENAADIRKMLPLWGDDVSREEYLAQLRWRLTLDPLCLPAPLPPEQTYFPTDLVRLTDDEVFVDCGAFDGDSVRSFLKRTRNSFRQIVPLEPDPTNYQNLRHYVAALPPRLSAKIAVQNVAVGATRKRVRFAAEGTAGSGISETGTVEMDCAPLDELLREVTPTYVKIDIEGAEPEALTGGRRLIERHSTVWAVCLYHTGEHLWQLPLFMASVSDGYRYFLRRYAEDCWELVCYAIPAERCLH